MLQSLFYLTIALQAHEDSLHYSSTYIFVSLTI